MDLTWATFYSDFKFSLFLQIKNHKVLEEFLYKNINFEKKHQNSMKTAYQLEFR